MLTRVAASTIAMLGILISEVSTAWSKSCVLMPDGVEVCETEPPTSNTDAVEDFLQQNGFSGFGSKLRKAGAEINKWNNIEYLDTWVRSPQTSNPEYYKNYLLRHVSSNKKGVTDFYIFSAPLHFNGNYYRSPREYLPRIYGEELSVRVGWFLSVCSNNVRAYAEQVAVGLGRSFSSAGRRPPRDYMPQKYVGPGWNIEDSRLKIDVWGSIFNTGTTIVGNTIEVNEFVFDDGSKLVLQQDTMCFPTLWVRKK